MKMEIELYDVSTSFIDVKGENNLGWTLLYYARDIERMLCFASEPA